MFDDDLLLDYMQNFYGYGNFQGDYWFVGMEEGGIKSVAEMQARITTWQNRGRRVLEDLADYHNAVGTIGITRFLGKKPSLQPTWKHLIRVLFSAEKKIYNNEHIRQYQHTQLGLQYGNHALLELLPLPNRSVNPVDWEYHRYSRLPYLADRKFYEKQLVPHRIDGLSKEIRRYQPKVVVFYGSNWIYRKWWQQIANVRYTESDPAIGTNGKTLFVIMKHPTAHGMQNTYFDGVGETIRTLVGSSS